MRRLNRKKTLSLVKELDAFPKVPDSYVETSASGGTVSLIAFTTMALLTIMEFSVYQDTWMKYEYEVDKDFSSKLRINIDITVAMKCQYVGADVLDLAETMVASADGLVYEPVIFDLSPRQKEWQRMLQLIQSRLQEEHSLQDVIFKSAFKSSSTALPPREDDSSQPPDACRIHGHLYVNKVAGNFHITVGKAIPHPRGHAHLAALVFFVRLCGIVGGIFSTTGMLHGIGKFIVEIIYCRFRIGSYKPISSIPFEDGHTDNHLPLLENNTH